MGKRYQFALAEVTDALYQ